MYPYNRSSKVPHLSVAVPVRVLVYVHVGMLYPCIPTGVAYEELCLDPVIASKKDLAIFFCDMQLRYFTVRSLRCSYPPFSFRTFCLTLPTFREICSDVGKSAGLALLLMFSADSIFPSKKRGFKVSLARTIASMH